MLIRRLCKIYPHLIHGKHAALGHESLTLARGTTSFLFGLHLELFRLYLQKKKKNPCLWLHGQTVDYRNKKFVHFSTLSLLPIQQIVVSHTGLRQTCHEPKFGVTHVTTKTNDCEISFRAISRSPAKTHCIHMHEIGCVNKSYESWVMQ